VSKRQLLSAQRNIYLTGFALFLSFILIRVFNLVAAWTDAEERAIEYEAAGRNAAKHQADLIASERNFGEALAVVFHVRPTFTVH
jgi:hypothetical protein